MSNVLTDNFWINNLRQQTTIIFMFVLLPVSTRTVWRFLNSVESFLVKLRLINELLITFLIRWQTVCFYKLCQISTSDAFYKSQVLIWSHLNNKLLFVEDCFTSVTVTFVCSGMGVCAGGSVCISCYIVGWNGESWVQKWGLHLCWGEDGRAGSWGSEDNRQVADRGQ